MRFRQFLAVLTAFSGGATFAWGQAPANGPIMNVSALVQIPPGQGALSAPLGVAVSAPSPLLIRADGPALAKFGLTGTAVGPYVNFYTGAGLVDWGAKVAIAWDWAAAAASVGAFPVPLPGGTPVNGQIPENSSDLETFQPGGYAARAYDNSWQGGTVLMELYTSAHLIPAGNLGPGSPPLSPGPPGFISNFSLLFSGSAASSQVLGFTLAAPTPVLIRAVGPSLAAFGVAIPARAATFQLRTSAGAAFPTVTVPAGAWPAIFQSVGAFPLTAPTGDLSAIAMLPAGAFTLTANDATGAGGTVLLEVYANPSVSQ